MLESRVFNSRKRQNSECLPPLHTSKRQKRTHSSGSYFPPAFWDNLSKIDLTKGALEEFGRRNTQVARSAEPRYQRPYRRITRGFLTKSKKSSQPLASAIGYLHNCGAKTLKQLKQTARHGGLDLSDLRGFPEPSNAFERAMSSSRSSSRVPKRSSTSTPKTKSSTNTSQRTGPYNRNFQQNLVDNGIYPEGYEYPDGRLPLQPDNWEDINRRLSEPRPSLSPSRFREEDFRKFKRADTHALKEKQVTTSVIPIIEGDIGDARCASGGIPFTNLNDLTDGTLVPGNPDFYYGARPEQLDRQVRNELSRCIIPSTQDDLPLAPNFFLAAKGPDGSLAVAGRQASYDGALGARGMYSLQSYAQELPVSNNKAYTITSIYHGGQLKMYTSHISQPVNPEDQAEYFMHQLNTWGMTGNIESFRQGATYYRNGREWAREQRDDLIKQANEKAREHQAEISSVHTSVATVDEPFGESQESSNMGNDTSNSTTDLQKSSSCDELTSRLIKRSNRHSLQSSPLQRKRHNAGLRACDSQQSQPELSEHSGLSQRFEDQASGHEPNLHLINFDKSTTTRKLAPNKKNT